MSGDQSPLPAQQHPPEKTLSQEAKLAASYTTFSGPVPPPGQLAGYEQVMKGLANRLVVMAENQSAHRLDVERTMVKSEAWLPYAGLGVGGGVTSFGMYLAYLLVEKGHDGYALGAVIAALVPLIGAFVHQALGRPRDEG